MIHSHHRPLLIFPCLAAVLTAVAFLKAASVTAAESVIFRPAYAPAPADNPLKGFVPYAGQGQKFPHSLEFNYLSLASMKTGPTNFNWAPMERLLDGIASRGCQSVFRIYMAFRRRPSGVPEYLVQAGVEVSVTITNRGVAPFYAGWPVQVVAIDSTGGESGAELPMALNKLLAAATDTQSVNLNFAKLTSGEIKLLLGITNPLKGGRPLRFANADAEPHRAGWLTLGKIALP